NTCSGFPSVSKRLFSFPFRKCVMTSFFSKYGITSLIFGGADPICTIKGKSISLEIFLAIRKGSMPLSPTTLLLIRAFNPTITSLYLFAVSTTFSGSIHSKLESSSVLFKPIRECLKRQANLCDFVSHLQLNLPSDRHHSYRHPRPW